MSYLMSEQNFRRNERYIHDIVEAYPNSVSFPVLPPITQSEILARNIRYAARSLLTSQWQPTIVNMRKFVQIWDDIICSTMSEPNAVNCGPGVRLDVVNEATVGPQQILPTVNVVTEDKELILSVVIMHHHRYLTEPSHITTKQLAYLTELEKKYDVAISHEGDVYTIL